MVRPNSRVLVTACVICVCAVVFIGSRFLQSSESDVSVRPASGDVTSDKRVVVNILRNGKKVEESQSHPQKVSLQHCVLETCRRDISMI